jgi:bifunctional N-acetylglucosamine-1-phosphate-uridyltransferase/glucosamine-1-phosphate-acetyltransferase GlmU-like protein
MLDYLFERYRNAVEHVVVIVSPSSVPAVRRYLEPFGAFAEHAVQPDPDGMLPAVLCARRAVETLRPDHVWITWCDQIGISDRTVRMLVEETERHPEAALLFPTVRQEPPYIHFRRDAQGRINGVLQRREGDEMPAIGESDAGLFALRLDAYLGSLVEYDRVAQRDAGTGERSFLAFIPWLAARAVVNTFPLSDPREALGVNTPDDLREVEMYLRERS